MKNLGYSAKVMPSISPVAIGTTGTGQAGLIVDRRGFDGVEFIAEYGAITSTTAVYTVVLKEGDATDAMTSIADADLIGTEADLGLGAATRTDGVGDKLVKRCGYKGRKRYVQVFKLSSTATAATPVAAQVLLFNPSSTGSVEGNTA